LPGKENLDTSTNLTIIYSFSDVKEEPPPPPPPPAPPPPPPPPADLVPVPASEGGTPNGSNPAAPLNPMPAPPPASEPAKPPSP
jgi:hypothetical protein